MILDETLLEEARRLTGVTEKTALVHEGLRALIAREHSSRLRRLAGLGSHGERGRPVAPPSEAMTLVDTSVWIDHLRHGDAELAALLDEGMVLVHPFVIGEIACGTLAPAHGGAGSPSAPAGGAPRHRGRGPSPARAASPRGRGLGWIDLHLLASARLAAVPADHARPRAARRRPVRPPVAGCYGSLWKLPWLTCVPWG